MSHPAAARTCSGCGRPVAARSADPQVRVLCTTCHPDDLPFYPGEYGKSIAADGTETWDARVPAGVRLPYSQSDDELLVTSLDGVSGLTAPPYPGDCGLDLVTAEDAVVFEGHTANIRCGVAVALPPRTFGWIVARSSTWTRHRLLVLPGIIDEGWRGELRVLVYRAPIGGLSRPDLVPVSDPGTNLGIDTRIPAGTRLAQLIVLPALLPGLTVTPVDKLDLPSSDRGTSGFGSSG